MFFPTANRGSLLAERGVVCRGGTLGARPAGCEGSRVLGWELRHLSWLCSSLRCPKALPREFGVCSCVQPPVAMAAVPGEQGGPGGEGSPVTGGAAQHSKRLKSKAAS